MAILGSKKTDYEGAIKRGVWHRDATNLERHDPRMYHYIIKALADGFSPEDIRDWAAPECRTNTELLRQLYNCARYMADGQ